MALNTQSMGGEVKRADIADAPEGYEFIRDEEGRMALKKIRKVTPIAAPKVSAKKTVASKTFKRGR